MKPWHLIICFFLSCSALASDVSILIQKEQPDFLHVIYALPDKGDRRNSCFMVLVKVDSEGKDHVVATARHKFSSKTGYDKKKYQAIGSSIEIKFDKLSVFDVEKMKKGEFQVNYVGEYKICFGLFEKEKFVPFPDGVRSFWIVNKHFGEGDGVMIK